MRSFHSGRFKIWLKNILIKDGLSACREQNLVREILSIKVQKENSLTSSRENELILILKHSVTPSMYLQASFMSKRLILKVFSQSQPSRRNKEFLTFSLRIFSTLK